MLKQHRRKVNPIVFGDDSIVRRIRSGEVTRTWRSMRVSPPEWAEQAGRSRFTPAHHVSFRGRVRAPDGREAIMEVTRPLPWVVGDVVPVREAYVGVKGTELTYRSDLPSVPPGMFFGSPMYAPSWSWRTGLLLSSIRPVRVLDEAKSMTPEQVAEIGWTGGGDPMTWLEEAWDSTAARIKWTPFWTNPWAWDLKFSVTSISNKEAA